MTDTLPAPIHLEAGATVPEWLIACEPMNPEAVLNHVRFSYPVLVYEAEDRFIVLPQITGNLPPMLDVNASHVRFYAPGKPAYLVLGFSTIAPLEVDAWVQGNPGQIQPQLFNPQGLSQPAMQAGAWEADQRLQAEARHRALLDRQLQIDPRYFPPPAPPEPRKGLLARLWAALKAS